MDELTRLYKNAKWDKPIFWVDKIDTKINWGITRDADKIEDNRGKLEDMYNLYIDTKLAINPMSYCVFGAGRFIIVLRSIGNAEQEMQFFDFRFNISTFPELEKIWEETYNDCEQIVNDCIKCYEVLSDNFSTSTDIFVLACVN
ncbi:MAG: hypothetical protein AB7G44_14260 [Bacteroidia bacterium]